MENTLYIEICLLCAIIVSILIHKLSISVDKQQKQRRLAIALSFEVALFLLDGLWALTESRTFGIMPDLNRVVNTLYFITSGFCGYSYFIYSESAIKSRLVDTLQRRLLLAIPAIVLTLLSVISLWTGWLFTIDESAEYHRGALYFIQVIIAYGYLGFTSVKSLVCGLMHHSKYEISHAYFGMISLVSCLLQMFIPGTPLLTCGVTISAIYLYISVQETLISIDPLTQLNNRNQLMQYLPAKMRNHGDNHLYLFIMDVDFFKKINDKYGHIEGDVALIRTADVLREIGAEHNAFLSRFGGDEFIVIKESSDINTPAKICESIEKAMNKSNVAAKTPYQLHLTVGYAEYSPEMKTMQQLIDKADAMLYVNKKKRNVGR